MTPTEQLRIAEDRYRHYRSDERNIDVRAPIDPVDLIDFLHRFFGVGHFDEDRSIAVSGFLQKYGKDPNEILAKQKWTKIAGKVGKLLQEDDDWNKVSDEKREKEIKRQRNEAAEKKKRLEEALSKRETPQQQQQQQQQEEQRAHSLQKTLSEVCQWYPVVEKPQQQQKQPQQQQQQAQLQQQQQPGHSRTRLSSIISDVSSKASKKDSTETVSSEWSGPDYQRTSTKGKRLQKRKEKKEEKKESSSEEEEEEERRRGTERALEQAQDFAHENRTGDNLLDTLKAAGFFQKMFDAFKEESKREKESRRRKERRRRHSSSSDESTSSRSSKKKSKKGHRSRHRD